MRYFLEIDGSRTYQCGPCRICGVWCFSAKPETKQCGACLPGRVARNENEGE